MKVGVAGLAILLAVVSLPAFAQGDRAKPDRITRVAREGDEVAVPYQLYPPVDYDKSKKYPLVLCLRGAGEMKAKEFEARTAASTALLKPEMRAKYPAFILVPQTTAGWVKRPGRDITKGGYRLADNPESPALKLVLKALSDTIKEYRVDPDRVYVTGQSMGGVATWDVIMRHPDLFAAAVPVCGVGDTTQAGTIRCPVWVFHGAKDKTVPVTFSRAMTKALEAAGGKVKYTEYPEVEHGSWGPAWQEEELIPWLFSQQRKKE